MDDPIEPSTKQINNSILFGWVYDPESFLFERGGRIGYFTTEGFKDI